jgi:FolB domain-containing protein
MDKLFLHNIHAQAIIGIYDWERASPRELLISLEISLDLSQVSTRDNLDDGVDYQKLADQIVNFVEGSNRYTLETLANDIAQLCLEYQGAVEVLVRIEKPGVLANVEAVGVELRRSR